MADNNDWLSRTLPGQRVMFANVKGKIGVHGPTLGLSPATVTAIEQLCSEFLAAYDYTEDAQATTSGVVEWRDLILRGTPVGAPAPAPPPYAVYVPTVGAIIGLIAKFREYRAQIVNASGYTQAIGEDLMIVKVTPLAPVDPTPTIAVSPAQTDYLYSIVVGNRTGSDAWTVQMRIAGGEWVNVGTFTGKSTDITVTPPVPGSPVQIEVRVQLRKNNQNFGNLSQVATVTVNP